MDAPELAPLLADWRNHHGPLHQRLATTLASLIDARLLRPGDRLPSERVLARRLAISRTTAAAAYDLLRQRGDLHSMRGSGTG